MSIKKAYIELVDFLETNSNKKVSTIIDEIIVMCESKTQSSTTMRDADNNVIAIFCYYHKQWELINEVEYGNKANSATGLNTMCKIGVSLWTKAQREAKKANAAILTGVIDGTIAREDIANEQLAIEAKRIAIDKTNLPKGFASEFELINFLNM